MFVEPFFLNPYFINELTWTEKPVLTDCQKISKMCPPAPFLCKFIVNALCCSPHKAVH